MRLLIPHLYIRVLVLCPSSLKMSQLPPTPDLNYGSYQPSPYQPSPDSSGRPPAAKRLRFDAEARAGQRNDPSDMRIGNEAGGPLAKPYQRMPPVILQKNGMANLIFKHRRMVRIRSQDPDVTFKTNHHLHRSYLFDPRLNHQATYCTIAEWNQATSQEYAKVEYLKYRVINKAITSPFPTADTDSKGAVSTLQGIFAILPNANQYGEYEVRTFTRTNNSNVIASDADPKLQEVLAAENYGIGGGMQVFRNLDQGACWLVGGSTEVQGYANGYIPSFAEKCIFINLNATCDELMYEWEYNFAPSDGVISSSLSYIANPELNATATVPATNVIVRSQYNDGTARKPAGATANSDLPSTFLFTSGTKTHKVNSDLLFDAYIGQTVNKQYPETKTNVIPNFAMGLVPKPTVRGTNTVEQSFEFFVETEIGFRVGQAQDHIMPTGNTTGFLIGEKGHVMQRNSYTGRSKRLMYGYPIVSTTQTRNEPMQEDEEDIYY